MIGRLVFQSIAKRPLSPGLPPVEGTLEGYRAIEHSFVPGI
jgi:hypothetical protein